MATDIDFEIGSEQEGEQMHEVQSKATQSAPLNELSSDNREQLLDVGLPAPVGLRCPTATTRAGDQGWLRSYEVIIIAKSVALFGFVAAMFALTALVAFSDVDILRGAREVQPRVTPIQSDISNVSRSEPIAMPGSAADRSKAVVDTLTPEKQVVNDSASPAPQPSRPGELASSLPGPMQEVAIAVRETVAVAPREMDTPPQLDAGQLDAIEKPKDRVALARDLVSEPAPLVVQSSSAAPTGGTETASRSHAIQPDVGEPPETARAARSEAVHLGPPSTAPTQAAKLIDTLAIEPETVVKLAPAMAGRAEAIEKTSNSNIRAVDANASDVPKPFQPAEPDSPVPGSAQRVTAEVQATSSAARPEVQESQGPEAGQPNATRVSALAAAASDPLMLDEAPAPTPTQAVEAANDAEPARIHETDPTAAATPATVITQALKPHMDVHDIASAAAVGAENRIEDGRGGVRAASLGETARAEQPDAARLPTSEMATAARPQARKIDGPDAGNPDAIRVPALAATASDSSIRDDAPATATTQASKPALEAHDPASARVAGAEHPSEGDRGAAPGSSFAETARAEQPNAARPPAREAAALAPAPRIPETKPEETPYKTAEADALVTRGDAFFAAGDLASARLFYEYAATAGNGTAALQLGGTFDPGFLARAHIGRVQGDAAIAVYWYRRARDLGNSYAEILLQKMEQTAR